MMDRPDRHEGLLAEDLRNLEVLNRLFGGREVVRRRLRSLLAEAAPGERLSALDVGSGAGDICRVAIEECRKRGHPLRLYSLDSHAPIQEYARSRLAREGEQLRFLRGDARALPLLDGSVDLCLCTLALHHFPVPEAEEVLREMRRVARRWVIVSDLCRSPQAYAGVWLATRFTSNAMTRSDGPVSVLRAYTGPELRDLAEGAGWTDGRFYAEPFFRMSLVERKERAWSRS